MTLPKKVYIVMGCSGQDEDMEEWPVAVYADKDKAFEHADKAGKADLRFRKLNPLSSYNYTKYVNPFDPTREYSFAVNFYDVTQVDMFEEVPA